MAKESRVGLESGSGSAARRRYERRLTIAREMMSTVWIERSKHTKEHVESILAVDEKNGWPRDSKWGVGTI